MNEAISSRHRPKSSIPGCERIARRFTFRMVSSNLFWSALWVFSASEYASLSLATRIERGPGIRGKTVLETKPYLDLVTKLNHLIGLNHEPSARRSLSAC